MTDDDLEVFGAIRDRVINTLDRWLDYDWMELLWIEVRIDGGLSVEIGAFGRHVLQDLIGDAISEAVAMVRSGKDKEIIAQLDARDAAATLAKEDAS